jgi:hypothetical protein
LGLQVIGASTLKGFTSAIERGFEELCATSSRRDSATKYLVQVHGSSEARAEDERILQEAALISDEKVFLLHRPDEILENPELVGFFERQRSAKIIFLGDLVFRYPFWAERRACTKVITHPQLDESLPASSEKLIVGAFTAWEEKSGNMRSIEH